MTYASGDCYQGEFEEGVFNGPGTLNYHNGDEYGGDFADGMRHGQGKLVLKESHSEYIGDFKND